MEETKETLATELLSELKSQNKRWFIAFLIMIGVEVATIGSFLWYISLPIEDVRVESTDTGSANYVGNDLNGVINNGEGTCSEEAGESPDNVNKEQRDQYTQGT